MLPCYGLYLKCMFHFIMLHAYTLIKSKKFFFVSVQDTEDKGPASIICLAKKKKPTILTSTNSCKKLDSNGSIQRTEYST